MDKENKRRTIQARVSEEEYKQIQAKCKEENRTPSNLVRTALKAYLEK